MAFLKKLDSKTKKVLKIAGLAVLGLAVIYTAFTLLDSFFTSLPSFQNQQINHGFSGYALSSTNSGVESEMSVPQSLGLSKSFDLSQRNVASSPTGSPYNTAGSGSADAEQYETTAYNVSYQTGQLKKTCASIAGLKSRQDVIFENASEYNTDCEYVFKVQRDKTNEILDILKNLKPKELATKTYTVQQQIQDFTNEITILQDKLASVNDTLAKATADYDAVSEMATKEKDVDSLAKIIDDKINTIQQLTQERIDINSQLDQIQQTKAQQLDTLNYTEFDVTATDSSFVNWQDIKDSWNAAVKYSINNINQTVQNISVSLVAFLFTLMQYVIYALILLFVAKYGWKLVKHIWLN